jgi:peptidoglycan/LPS O-acetylase OafA/YrhL
MRADKDTRISPYESDLLNVLRGLAIIGVVAMHSIQVTDSLNLKHTSAFVSQILYLGKYGVEVFFFLSGWLLTALYGLNQNRLPKSYAIRRFARIFPLWTLFLCIYLAQSFIMNSGGFYDALNSKTNVGLTNRTEVIILLTLTFTLFISSELWNTVIPGGWSIQSEVAHYFLFPVIRQRGIKNILLVTAIINFFSTGLLLLQSKTDQISSLIAPFLSTWLRLGLYSTFSFFLFGILAQRIYTHRQHGDQNDSWWEGKEFGLFILSSFCIDCPVGVQIEAIGYLCINVLLAISLVHFDSIRRGLIQIGNYSYFIYFVHFLILKLMYWQFKKYTIQEVLFGNQLYVFAILFLATIFCSIMIAIPSRKYLEIPILQRVRHKG